METLGNFTIRTALEYGFKETKKHFWFFAGIFVCFFILLIILGNIEAATEHTQPLAALMFRLVGAVVQMVMTLGLIHIALSVYSNEPVKFKDLFSQTHRFVDYLVARVLYGLIVLAGLLLLIVPGFIWMMTYMFFGYALVDKNLKPRAALRESARITKGKRWKLFGFSMVVLLVNILGALALGIGLFITVPTTYLAVVYVYKQLSMTPVVSESIPEPAH